MVKMEYTGERMVPEDADMNTFWEHIYRYRFALPYVHGNRVLDIACGEGYGSAALLQSGATSMTGVDISAEACEHATRRYGITTKVGNARNIPLDDKSVEVVVSFETIEHTDNPDQFMDECARVLVPGGKLVISTPNLDSRDSDNQVNPFHLKELGAEEFFSLLKARFCRVEIFTQCPKYAAWWSPRSLAASRSIWQSLPGSGRVRKLMQRIFCPEVQDANDLKQARENPVQAILAGREKRNTLANPFVVRRHQPASKEVPIYFVAIASL